MKVNVQLDNGFLPDKYTKHAPDDQKIDGQPAISFPFQIQDVPHGTQSIAFMVIDFDSIPVCGYAWIHWSGANLSSDTKLVPENASQSGEIQLIQGNNSTDIPGNVNHSPLAHHYVGPTPPSGTHDYQLTVFALDQKLDLKDGYWLNELLKQTKNHTLDQVTVHLPVKA